MTGRYVHGCGKAHRHMRDLSPYFGDCPMVGTFNVRANASIEDFQPVIADDARRFWLLRLNDQSYVWAYRWAGSKMPPTILELVTKAPAMLPDNLKHGIIDIDVMEPWSYEEISQWVAQQYWFQSFTWGPQRANSELVWRTVDPHVLWPGKMLLDIGCHYGAHSIAASKAGAAVIGFDTDLRPIQSARTINDHIEMQDVRYVISDPGGTFDVIFYFSVHHQFDPAYETLSERLRELQNRAREAVFVEAFAPALGGALTAAEVDAIVGGETLHTYQHAVRGVRRIYKLEGQADV